VTDRPSYEIKSDYAKVECLHTRQPAAVFRTRKLRGLVPHHSRSEAHELPRRLKTSPPGRPRPGLHATLAIGQSDERNVPGSRIAARAYRQRHVVINPPHTLKPGCNWSCHRCCMVLGRGRGKAQGVEAGA